jgi:hypothetical protein
MIFPFAGGAAGNARTKRRAGKFQRGAAGDLNISLASKYFSEIEIFVSVGPAVRAAQHGL